jgi:hypothetical protein
MVAIIISLTVGVVVTSGLLVLFFVVARAAEGRAQDQWLAGYMARQREEGERRWVESYGEEQMESLRGWLKDRAAREDCGLSFLGRLRQDV